MSITLQNLITLIKADFDAQVAGTGEFNIDDPKWDKYPFEVFEKACMELGLA